MCFGGKPKMAKQANTPTAVIPPTQPIENQLPSTQSGADIAAAGQKPRKKSMFQIDLSIPTGASTGNGQSVSNGVGAKV